MTIIFKAFSKRVLDRATKTYSFKEVWRLPATWFALMKFPSSCFLANVEWVNKKCQPLLFSLTTLFRQMI